jgi:ribosome-associated translation inhibitor RaiA
VDEVVSGEPGLARTSASVFTADAPNKNNKLKTMTTSMKLYVQHLNLPALATLDAWVEKQIFTLGRTRQIDEANIRLIRLENASPAFQVNVHLVTPGQDVFAESRDHTLRAAFEKALKQLRAQITSRATQRLHRLKSHAKARRGG